MNSGTSDDSSRIATAYHEAGHAVVAHSLGRLLHKVTIKAGRSAYGDRRLGVCDRVGSDKQHQRVFRRWLDKTEHLLHDPKHWNAVELVAAALLEKETIRGRTVRHYFNQAKSE